MSDNQAVATKVLRELARLGVREFAVAAGARNAPLLAPLLASRGITVRHFFDERSAAFFALGRIMVDRSPVALITTSGTAVGELLPAVMEAHYQGLPLVLVTADRPKRFRGSGAPQAVDQPGIFGCYAESTLDLDAESLSTAWPAHIEKKPLHVNVCFDEPLDCIAEGIEFGTNKPSAPPNETSSGSGARSILESWLETREGLVVLAGGIHPECVESVAKFLRAVNAPVIAEATSNLHGRSELHDLLVTGGDRALSQMKIRRVLRIGSVPSGRWWRDLEQHPEIAVLNICDPAFPGLARTENVETTGLDLLSYECDHCVGARVTSVSAALRTQFETITSSSPKSELAWIRNLSRAIPAGARVFLGNSLPIREWNLAADPARPGTAFFANRGANGIDGIVSTFLGVSATTHESWLIIGDLSALYDLSAPWILQQLPAGNRRIVVINNGGGKIFSRVDSLRSLDEQTRAVIENRHSLSFESWAQMWGMSYTLCTSANQLPALPDGNSVIEIHPDTAQTELFWQHWNAR